MARRTVLPALLVALALVGAGCAAKSNGGGAQTSAGQAGASSSGAGAPSATSSGPAPCSPATLATKHKGSFTVATDSPAYSPWFVDDKPANGKGFESAVAYAVAAKLGYAPAAVHWTVATFNSVIAPTPKKFDVDINEFSITAERAKVVDFSTGYYDVAQAVVTLKKSRYAKATTVAALHGAKLAAQKGTTSLDAITGQIKPGTSPAEFPTNDLAVQALKNGQVDGLVVDLPTAFYVTSAQVQNATIVGQLPVHGAPEQFGMVLQKDSPITSCVSKAVDALRADGTLARLQDTWLASAGNAPKLK